MSEDTIKSAVGDIIARMKNPLTPEQKAIVQRTLNRLNGLVTRAITAPADEIEQIKNDAKADIATLASIADAAAAEALDLFAQHLVRVVSGITGKMLRIV